MSATPVFEARALSQRFGPVTALRSLDLDVAEGQLLSLFGPNGAGKTTLLRLLATLARPSSGELRYRGRELSKERTELRRELGLVSHESLLYDALTARENLAFVARLHGLEDAAGRVERLLADFELQERADRPVRQLSRGLRQRASIARALVADPSVLLLDEPFTGLDRQAAELLTQQLSSLRENGRTILLVTHDLQAGLSLADRVLVLRRGRLALDRSATDFDLASFESAYLQAVSGEERTA